MKRPKAHQIGELAENYVECHFLSEGWIVHRCLPDYGFDFLVEPPSEEVSYSNLAFIQVKGTEKCIHPKADGTLPFSVSTKYLVLWVHTNIPAYLCVVELESKRAMLCNTGYLINQLKRIYEKEAQSGQLFLKWLTEQETRTVLLEPIPMTVEGDRLQRMSVALQKVWEKLRETQLSARSPDMAWSPVMGVIRELEKAFTVETASRLFKKTGARIYGDF